VFAECVLFVQCCICKKKWIIKCYTINHQKVLVKLDKNSICKILQHEYGTEKLGKGFM
jgi:hypothetical protein